MHNNIEFGKNRLEKKSHFWYRKVHSIVGNHSFSVIIPKDFATNLGIGKGDFVKVCLEGEKITMKKAD